MFLVLIFISLFTNLIICQEKSNSNINISIGTPIRLCLGFGGSVDSVKYNLRAGGWFDGSYGFQGDLFYEVLSTGNFDHNIGISFGLSKNELQIDQSFFNFVWGTANFFEQEDVISLFAGGSYQIEFKNWFLLAGAVVGTKNFENPRFILQYGYSFPLDDGN